MLVMTGFYCVLAHAVKCLSAIDEACLAIMARNGNGELLLREGSTFEAN